MKEELLKTLPSIREVLALTEGVDLPKWALLEAARACVAARRKAILEGAPQSPPIEAEEVIEGARTRLSPSLREVINATGVVLHTNLGRSPLAEEAIARVVEVARGYSNLELDLQSGERGSRHDHVAALASALTGAEAAAVVNNNAAAVLLTLSALAPGKGVIVSRGELVEIGGSFRIPEILALSGARMIEVGATNRTHLYDYERVLSDAEIILKVHRSNFALVGFTTEPSRRELVEISRKNQKLFIEDLGSGCLLDEPLGGAKEPTAQEAISAGVDVVTISGDKLLGGPQAGLILGRRALISKIKKHPMARAVRVDKMTLAALEATLSLYRDGKSDRLPVWSMLRESEERLYQGAVALAGALLGVCSFGEFRPERVTERVGGGALPLSELRGAAVVCQIRGYSAQELEGALRRHPTPILARLADDRLWLHLRGLSSSHKEQICAFFRDLPKRP